MFRYLGSKDLMILIVLTIGVYIVVERYGLFRLEPASYREAFHSTPIKAASILLLINVLLSFRHCRGTSGWMRAGICIFCAGLIIMIIGFWVSIFTRFEGNFVRDEGATFNAFKNDYIQETLYMNKHSSLPSVGFTFHRIDAEADEAGKELKKVSAAVTYAGRTTDGLINKTIDSDSILISDWTMISFADFGYSTKLVLYDLGEKELERKKIYMKLFPAGSEERAETMFLGYSFYVRLYPDYVDINGTPGTKSLYPKNPMYNLRVVRNKDILYAAGL